MPLGGSGAGSCAAPYVDDQPPGGQYDAPRPTVSAGGALTIYGHWYKSTCFDTGQGGVDKPLPPVTLTLTLPDGRSSTLGPFMPGEPDMGFTTIVMIPADATPGTATITDDVVFSDAPFQFIVGNAHE